MSAEMTFYFQGGSVFIFLYVWALPSSKFDTTPANGSRIAFNVHLMSQVIETRLAAG